MPLDKKKFAEECVHAGVIFGISPHYLLGVAELRSGCSDDSEGDLVGPFRLTQAEWEANRENHQFDFHFTSDEINKPVSQCIVFAFMSVGALNVFYEANKRYPSAVELYLQQWPSASTKTLSEDLQVALDRVAISISAAGEVVSESVPIAIIEKPDQSMPPVAEPHRTDAYVPFRDDAPSRTDDTLNRGRLALFLARRLHLIWCSMNGCAPEKDRGSPQAAASDAKAAHSNEFETFIIHIDSPWGGGKTTFANFVAGVLKPPGSVDLGMNHFLRFTAPADATPEALKKFDLSEIFYLGSSDEVQRNTERGRWKDEAKQPWIIAWYNAWRDQYVQPPWWHIFLSIVLAIEVELKKQTRGPNWFRASCTLWRLRLAKARYQLFNMRIKQQLLVLGFTVVAGVIIWRTGLITSLISGSATPVDSTKRWIDLLIAALGIGGVSIATLFSLVGQSLQPELDFTAEHKQIGVRDPIGRFRAMFGDILRLAGCPILLIIDDIDRCDPKTVVEVLRGFQTIIRSPRLCVLVLGDRAWIEKAYEIQHKDFTDIMSNTENTLGERFVQKIFQLSFTLPAMRPDARDRFTRAVLGAAEQVDAGSAGAATAQQVGAPTETQRAQAHAQAALNAFRQRIAALPETRTIADFERNAAKEKDTFTQKHPHIKPREFDAIISNAAVARTGTDAGYQRQLSNILFGLAASLPNNPRQIKRIINAFAIYETVGRLYYNYQFSRNLDNETQSRRWRQLAIWTTLATEWPQTWRKLSREPRYVEAAYADTAEARKAMRQELLSEIQDANAKLSAETFIGHLQRDLALARLLCTKSSPREVSAVQSEQSMFADIRIDAEAIYEFNRIMWEPGFPMRAMAASAGP